MNDDVDACGLDDVGGQGTGWWVCATCLRRGLAKFYLLGIFKLFSSVFFLSRGSVHRTGRWPGKCAPLACDGA